MDKDRHIGNIEHQLTVARPYVQNWSALAEAWARVETKLLEAPPAEPPSPANWSEDRMDRTLQSADDLQRRLIEKDKNIQNLQGEVQKLAGETGKLDGAVRSLEEEVQSVNEGNQRLLQELDELRTELEENRERPKILAGAWIFRSGLRPNCESLRSVWLPTGVRYKPSMTAGSGRL